LEIGDDPGGFGIKVSTDLRITRIKDESAALRCGFQQFIGFKIIAVNKQRVSRFDQLASLIQTGDYLRFVMQPPDGSQNGKRRRTNSEGRDKDNSKHAAANHLESDAARDTKLARVKEPRQADSGLPPNPPPRQVKKVEAGRDVGRKRADAEGKPKEDRVEVRDQRGQDVQSAQGKLKPRRKRMDAVVEGEEKRVMVKPRVRRRADGEEEELKPKSDGWTTDRTRRRKEDPTDAPKVTGVNKSKSVTVPGVTPSVSSVVAAPTAVPPAATGPPAPTPSAQSATSVRTTADAGAPVKAAEAKAISEVQDVDLSLEQLAEKLTMDGWRDAKREEARRKEARERELSQRVSSDLAPAEAPPKKGLPPGEQGTAAALTDDELEEGEEEEVEEVEEVEEMSEFEESEEYTGSSAGSGSRYSGVDEVVKGEPGRVKGEPDKIKVELGKIKLEPSTGEPAKVTSAPLDPTELQDLHSENARTEKLPLDQLGFTVPAQDADEPIVQVKTEVLMTHTSPTVNNEHDEELSSELGKLRELELERDESLRYREILLQGLRNPVQLRTAMTDRLRRMQGQLRNLTDTRLKLEEQDAEERAKIVDLSAKVDAWRAEQRRLEEHLSKAKRRKMVPDSADM